MNAEDDVVELLNAVRRGVAVLLGDNGDAALAGELAHPSDAVLRVVVRPGLDLNRPLGARRMYACVGAVCVRACV